MCSTNLRPQLQYVFERHAQVGQLVLKEHNDIVVVLVYQFGVWRFAISLLLALLHV